MNSTAREAQHAALVEVCRIDDLVPGSGVCALVEGAQVAIFLTQGASGEDPEVFAISNRDPVGDANVLSRGVIGDIGGEPVVASPLYKQHFSLLDGRCLEDGQHVVAVYPVHLDGRRVLLQFGA